jgi:anion-transporting  ArsA/GET3 family ATPase
MQGIEGFRFITVVGKGGVGRTTVSAALALSAARRGRRVLVAMCNVKERLSYLLQVDPIGPHIRPVLPNIEAVNIKPEVALEEYGLMILKVRALYKIVFENRFVAAFLRGTPGLDAWALLGKAQFHARETDRQGRYRYDAVILDAPATGHAVDMLRIPRLIMQAAPPGRLRREAQQAWELFSDPSRSGVCLVTLPEELPTNETLQLYNSVRDDLGLPVCGLVVNQVLERLFASDEGAIFDALTEKMPQESALASLIAAGRARYGRERIQQQHLRRLAEAIRAPLVELPWLSTPSLRRAEIEKLSEVIGRATGR